MTHILRGDLQPTRWSPLVRQGRCRNPLTAQTVMSKKRSNYSTIRPDNHMVVYDKRFRKKRKEKKKEMRKRIQTLGCAYDP